MGDMRTLDENQRCYDAWRRDTAGLSKKEAKAKLMNYFNVHSPPFRVNSEGGKAILWYMVFDPLHCNKIGAMSDVVNNLHQKHPKLMDAFLDSLSLSRARAGMPGLQLNG